MNAPKVLARSLRRFGEAPPVGDLPTGTLVELEGRGTAFVLDLPGPPGAPTLLLFHALGCTAYLSWYPALAALSEHYRVVAFDQRWHGRGIQSADFRLTDCAHDAIAVADALGIERFTAVGYSMGGAIAQLTWRLYPKRVEGLVLCAIARNFRGTVKERLWFSMTQAAMVKFSDRAREHVHRLADAVGAAVPVLPAAGDKPGNWAYAQFRSTSAWSMLAVIDEIGRFDSAAWIGRVNVPTSVVVATQDSLIPTRRQRKLAAAIPGAVSFDVEGNHAAMVLGAEQFVPVLVTACRSVTRRLRDRDRDQPAPGPGSGSGSFSAERPPPR